MKITTLVDNVVYGGHIVAEHGLSLLIQDRGKKVLFDTGQGEHFTRNAKVLGIDLSEVDAAVISHGHYDHAGGLEEFCKINRHAPVYVKEAVFARKYRGQDRFIGVERPQEPVIGRVRFVSGTTEILPGLFVMPQIPLVNLWDTHFRDMKIEEGGSFRKDEFDDEQCLVIKNNGRIHLVSGCSHRGITNILRAASKEFRLPFGLVLGGFHLKDCGKEQTGRVLNELFEFDVERIGVCHCTGLDAYVEMKKHCNGNVHYSFTGYSVEL